MSRAFIRVLKFLKCICQPYSPAQLTIRVCGDDYSFNEQLRVVLLPKRVF